MNLTTLPDFDRIKNMWNHFWNKELCKRPIVVATVVKPGTVWNKWESGYYYAVSGQYDKGLAFVDECIKNTIYLGESIPYASPDHGPDQFAAILGTELHYSEGSKGTNWASPVIENWDDFLPIKFDPNNSTWKSLITYSKLMAEHAKNRYLVGVCDLHSNIDALSALRNPEKLCMDFYEYPDQIAQAMKQVRSFYGPIYNGLYEAGGMNQETGTIGWAPLWCKGKYATIQADFICMVSPEISREYIIPALEEEANFLDHCVYHLDGPNALIHLDDILSIKKIDVIQWIPGAGQLPPPEWIDVLKKCQQAGKGLQIYEIRNLETVKRLCTELDPAGLVLCIDVKTEQEVNEIIGWLEKNI